MGMYTEVVLKFEISKTIDVEALDVLMYLFKNGDEPTKLPDHKFFELPRWSMIGRCSSFYHHPVPVNSWYEVDYSDTAYIFSRSDLKDYNNEIDNFVEWVKQYVEGCGELCIGYKWYEEDMLPQSLIIYKGE